MALVGGDDGKLRPWHYTYVYSIESGHTCDGFTSGSAAGGSAPSSTGSGSGVLKSAAAASAAARAAVAAVAAFDACVCSRI